MFFPFNRHWYRVLIFLPLLLFLGGAKQPERRDLSDRLLSGKISLTLDNGIWKLWEEEPVYQDMTLDLICDRGKCESEIWGYAPSFNKDVDHQGTVTVKKSDRSWQLEITLQVQSHPGNPELSPAIYQVEIIPHKGKLLGSYQGTYQERTLIGKVKGAKDDLQFTSVAEHQAIEPREHPRLIFRASELPQIKAKAQTPQGKAIIKQLKQTLTTEIFYDGYVPTGGYHAAGHCFLALLEDNQQAADKAWQIVSKSIANPGKRFLEHSPIVAGVALAYDLCYQKWDENQQREITTWLTLETVTLIKGDTPKNGWNSYAWSNWNARARGAAGLAALAILNEPAEYYPQNEFFQQPEDAERLLAIARRNVIRYLDTAVGDRGLGTEGDHYTTEPWRLTILPFLQGYRQVKGMNLAPSKTQWFLPHYISRTIALENGLTIPAYGRHRLTPPPSLYGIGLPLVSERFLPGVLWFFTEHQADLNYGVSSDLPISGIYALQGYPVNGKIINPDRLWHRVLVDQQKGFYSFRNQWQDKSDIVASMYVKNEKLRASWSFPDAGSIRIAGLGHHWATAGASKSRPENENIVVTRNSDDGSAKTVYSQIEKDGSGVVSLQKRNWLRSFAVDYSQAGGVPGLFAIADSFKTENTSDFRPKVWNLHVTGEVEIKDNQFLVTSPDGATMQGTFVSPPGVQLSNFKKDGNQKIQAQGINDFFVVLTIQPGKPPPIKIEGSGIDSLVTIGKQKIHFNGENLVLGVKE